MTDEELARRAAGGDAAALDELLRRHTPLVHGVCRRVLGNPDDALDATQEALIAIATRIAGFDGRSRFTTWCYRIATNAAIDEARRRNRRPVPAETTPDPPVAGPEAAVTDRLFVDAALARLGPDARAAVALRDLIGLDYAEIAEVLDIPAGTVRSRIARGRAALAELLGNQDGAPRRQTDPGPPPAP
ncbi:MAG: RNA polymerase sigma factor [Actinomycetota bacterium]